MQGLLFSAKRSKKSALLYMQKYDLAAIFKNSIVIYTNTSNVCLTNNQSYKLSDTLKQR